MRIDIMVDGCVAVAVIIILIIEAGFRMSEIPSLTSLILSRIFMAFMLPGLADCNLILSIMIFSFLRMMRILFGAGFFGSSATGFGDGFGAGFGAGALR